MLFTPYSKQIWGRKTKILLNIHSRRIKNIIQTFYFSFSSIQYEETQVAGITPEISNKILSTITQVHTFSNEHGRNPRLYVAELGEDSHHNEAKIMATMFADLGYDVDIGSATQTPKQVVKLAIENDVHTIGINCDAGDQILILRQLAQELKNMGNSEILLLLGAKIGNKDTTFISKMGINLVSRELTWATVTDCASDLIHLINKKYNKGEGIQLCKKDEKEEKEENEENEEPEPNIHKINEFQTKINKEIYYTFLPIGHINSVFREITGTPRNFGLAPNARASLKLSSQIDPSALHGLSEYSHIWLIWASNKSLDSLSQYSTTRANPKCGPFGTFATRFPARFNPMGLSAAKIIRIESDIIYLSGIDLVHGTPILDIKPYHFSDAINPIPKVPQWALNMANEQGDFGIHFSENTKLQIGELIDTHKLQFYDNLEDVMGLISEVLKTNPQRLHIGDTYTDTDIDNIHVILLDNMEIIYKLEMKNMRFCILYIRFIDIHDAEAITALRSAEWRENIRSLL